MDKRVLRKIELKMALRQLAHKIRNSPDPNIREIVRRHDLKNDADSLREFTS